ncbi:hypothetical protein ASD64_19915 [Mesorhizobium sp. Root157]|uniref:terminase small subunit n=1 Tax=Mesorhizobium sp. Root157 TaxID=1736477 RepID=UPI000701D6C4|nr:terminase small subunit [Mesorhizobium sp. Root157]KQZ87854.1 hypothetical protein ASD64_19915 [Mesorhizobium sp. Root157]
MKPMKNPKYEAFCQGMAKGMTASAAYLAAGYKGDRTAASRLSTNVNIRRRIAEIIGETTNMAQKELGWQARDLFTRVRKISEAALEAGDLRTALAAEKFTIECFGYRDSPTLTHEHVNGTAVASVDRPPEEGRREGVARVIAAMREVQAKYRINGAQGKEG